MVILILWALYWKRPTRGKTHFKATSIFRHFNCASTILHFGIYLIFDDHSVDAIVTMTIVTINTKKHQPKLTKASGSQHLFWISYPVAKFISRVVFPNLMLNAQEIGYCTFVSITALKFGHKNKSIIFERKWVYTEKYIEKFSVHKQVAALLCHNLRRKKNNNNNNRWIKWIFKRPNLLSMMRPTV